MIYSNEMLTWGFMNVMITALPLFANGVAHKRAGKSILSPTLFEDGFLYFLTFLFSLGLAADCVKALMVNSLALPTSVVIGVLSAGFVVCLVTWSTYCDHLRVRLIGQPKVSILFPLLVAGGALMLTIAVRVKYSLW
jgi:hypothetical protein